MTTKKTNIRTATPVAPRTPIPPPPKPAASRWLVAAVACCAGAISVGAFAVHRYSSAATPPTATPGNVTVATAMPALGKLAGNMFTTPMNVVLASGAAKSTHSAADIQVAKWQAKVQKNPNDAISQLNLGDALMQKARETADITYYQLAEACYKQAIAVDPTRYDAFAGLAWVTSGRHEFEQSIQWANKALAINPLDEDAIGLIGDADVEMGKYDEAYKQYQKMLDIRPDLSSYSRGAHLLFLMGNTRKALFLMNSAIKTGAPFAENTAWCRAQIATMLWSNGAILPAEQIAADALSKTPHNYHLLLIEGKIKSSRADYPGAIEAYKRAIEVAPQHEALILLGDLYELTGNHAEAKRQYDLVETIYKMNKSKGMKGDWAMAKFYADHDRNHLEALKMAQEEYKTRPNVAVADALSWCYYKVGNYREAARYSDRARAFNTPEASYLFHAGMIAGKLGDRPRAQTLLYQATSLNPHFNPLDMRLADAAYDATGSKPPVVHIEPTSNKIGSR